MEGRHQRMHFSRVLLLFVLLLRCSVDALRVTSTQLSNATVWASTDLLVAVDIEGSPIAADAVFSFMLPSQLLLYDATTSDVADVDTALLATQLDGAFQVTIADSSIVISRGADATDVSLTNSPLTFRLRHLTTPSVAGSIALGSFSIGNAVDAVAAGSMTLPSVWISPGRLWSAHLEFSNLISGRSTSVTLSFTPSNAVPVNGSIFIHFPSLYSSLVLQDLTLASGTNVSGTLQLHAMGTTLQVSWVNDTSDAAGGLLALQMVVLSLNGLQHPLLEGPLGRSIRIDTTDVNNNIINQEYLDISDLLLARATIQLSTRYLSLQEAGSDGQYSLSLSAPPEFSSGISINISTRVLNSFITTSAITVEPSLVHFLASNWSQSINLSVKIPDDNVALALSSQFTLSHSIVEAATETSYAPVDDVIVYVQDNDLPLVHLSSRYVAVAEGIRSDAYNITLLAQPSTDVVVNITSQSPLVSVAPSTLTFTSSSWTAIQTVRVQAQPGGGVLPSSAVRTMLTHHVSSSDAVFQVIVPQENILVYYEPLNLVSCVEPCRPGWYPFVNTTTSLSQCLACPLGSYCPGDCALPVPCAPGTHSSTPFATDNSVCVACAVGSYANIAGLNVCAPCPGGAACPRPDATFEPCPIGTFALESQGSCQPCPVGTYSNSSSRDHCDSCPHGSFCAGGTALPMACPNGTYAVEAGAKPCVSCPAGTYSNTTTRDHCDSCPIGFYCAGNTALPLACPNGTYAPESGAIPCQSCPAGYVCSNSSAAPVKCPDGTYSLAGDLQCRLCPQGYYCPNTALTPIKCGQGTYSHAGAANCTVCPFGYTCAVPDLPKACGVGEISNGNHSACVSCPPGYACPIGGDLPVQCAAGSFSVGGAIVCTPCTAGYACLDTTSPQRVACLAGTYSVGGAASCTPCPAGYACPTNNSIAVTPCPTGWYSPEGSAACTECPRGYYCDVPYELPKNCTVGSYSVQASTSCVPCDPGYECPRSDQLPQPCPVGYYSGGAVANCKACRPGYKCGLASTNPTPPEDACPMGGYCNPPTTFFLCPAGTYGNVTAGESVDQACAPCPEGYYCEMGSTPLTRQNCPAGYVCPIGTKRGSQFPCPPGTFNPLPNQVSLDVCQLCPAGSFCVQGSANPVVCPQGYYCPEGTLSANQYPCPAGTYSGPKTGLTIASQCEPCELGTYCPEASSTPTPCPAGTYNPSTGSAKVFECLDCPPGWSCPRVGQFEYVDRCAKGHYCPSGTVVATANPCPAGTYTDRIDLIRVQDCTTCPLRHACPEGTGGETQTMLDCGAGFFCPNGTAYAKQYPCPPGYWSTSTSLADATECDICPVGQYCSGGKAFIDGPCSPGYYCPLGTPSPTKFPCPSGTFTAKTWLFQPSQCDDCPPGSYCPAGSVAPIACKPGSYSSFNNTKTVGPGVAWPDCVTCPAGYFCPEGAVTPLPCGKGNFSTRGSKFCSLCEAGYFCNSNTTSDTNMHADIVSWLAPGSLYGKCYNGTYCPPGSDHEPALGIDACPRGYFCPKATPAPVICPAGTYSNLTGQDEMSDCTPTPAGFYSLEGSLQPTGPCDPGFYCPLRSTSKTQIPCPARYYLNRTSGQSEEDCAVCVAGSFCPIGSAYPIVCPTGAYCRTGVSSPEPCPIGTYSNATGIKHVEDCLVCPPGMYCDSTGLTVPRGPCDPGYYCTLGSYTSAPMNYETTLFGVTNRNVGGQCPPGSFCPLGSAFPTPCPSGTYNNVTGLEMDTQCVPCPPGKYCETPGLVVPTGNCFSGYYCTGGANTPTQVATPAGSFTGNGSTVPVPCPAGQFNSYDKQERCVDCPAGFFCGSPGTVSPAICPLGNYCPLLTVLPIKCPPGTFNAMQGLVSVSQCQNCTAGYFCDSFGLTAPSGQCLEGFVCTGASPVSNPIAAVYGFVCPAGYYCPAGSGAATPCPHGSFRPTAGGTSLASCSLCPGGSFCGDTALTAPSGLCHQGYFCTLNVSSATPSGDPMDGTGGPCPMGSFCIEGSTQPQLCPEGTYSDQLRAVTCTPCPAGYFCPLGSAGYASSPCPQGYYCPIGTKRDVQFPCLPGTYGNRTGLQDVSQCTPAPGGMFIEAYAATKASGYCKSGFYCSGGSSSSTPPTTTATGGPCLPGTNCPEGSAVPIVCDAGSYCSSSNTDKALPCEAGFYCVQGSYTATPTGQNNSLGLIGDVCTPGHFCPVGTSNPVPCPPGTFSENPQNANVTQCFPCPPGFLCSVSGIVTAYEKCPAGFLCTGGEREATQRCPQGFECPLGSSAPTLCPSGTFSDVDGLSQCKLCPERYFCIAGTITPEPCPVGYYCPLQTPTATKYPCLPGTYSNTTLLASALECASCPPGQFCSGAAPTDRPTGLCAPGYYCIGGATTATPIDGVTGDRCAGGFVCIGGAWMPDPIDNVTGSACQPGFYCPRGSSIPIRCAKGSYNAFEKQASCLPCPVGGYCDTNATTKVPCPLRYYCPEATVEPVLCPSGTYGHATGLETASQCAPCAAGKFCVGGTLTASCAAGYYCRLYNLEPNPPLNTTASAVAIKPLGFDFGGPCPVGHYCPEGVLDPNPCPNSTARLDTHGMSVDDCGPCPAGMSCEDGAFTVACPAGHYCAYGQSAVACPAGTYNPLPGQSKLSDCMPCVPGKLCNTTAIVDLTDWYDCPTGHYCLEASTAPIACPKGRFRRTRGAVSVDDCALCTGGSYCGNATVEPVVCASQVYCPTGSAEPIPCPGGSYCPSNATIPVPCPDGFYCPLQVALPIACERGFYCPSNSVAPLACPLGYIGRMTPLNGVLSRLTDACEPCPSGTYGIDPNRTRCEVCLEGYVCLEATRASRPANKDQDNGYPCPPGYYCPAGSSKELPCPSGTYQPNTLAFNATDCRPCPVDSYQNNVGQPNCLPCSTSAFAATGATVCTCKGSHRAFQMTDGYCICEPGFEFYDQNMVLRSDEDGDVDCQPIVYDRCGTNQVRSDSGTCVPASQTSCLKSCGNSTGTLVANLGICQCDKQTDVDTVCNQTCRDTASQLRVDPASGELQVYNPVTGTVDSLASSGIVSKVSCTSAQASDCQLQSVSLTTSGFEGSYEPPTTVETSAQASGTQRQRRLASGGSTIPTIANPMVCLHVGQGLFFDLSTPGSFPIYLKDSMLNTNPNFDYGAFRALATKVKSNASTVSAFAFSFTEPGIYVFGNSLNGATKTVITVMQAGTACPTEAAIVPLSEKNLIAVSVKRRTDDMILAPDWGLIIGLLGGLVGLVVAVIAGLYYFRTKSWATSSTRRRLMGYRAASKATDLATMHSKGVATANKTTASASAAPISDTQQTGSFTPAPVMVLDDGKLPAPNASSSRWSKPLGVHGDHDFQPDLARWEEEDLDLRELVERLQQHHDAITKCFDDQKGDVQSLLQHLQNEADEMKRLLTTALATTPVSSVVDPGPLGALPAHVTAVVTPHEVLARPPSVPSATKPISTTPAPLTATTPRTSTTIPQLTLVPSTTKPTGALSRQTSAQISSVATVPSIAAALTLPPADLEALRLAAETEAQATVSRQAEMQREYATMLRTEFPQLSDDERQRLMEEFAMDLGRMVSSLNVEAQKTEEGVKTMLTARSVMVESHARAMRAAADQQKRAVEQEQQRRLTTLESKYAQEEDEIEQEYQRELQRLEQEFAALGEDEGGGDEALPSSDLDEDDGAFDAFDDMDEDGDEATPRDAEEEDGDSDEEKGEETTPLPTARSMVVETEGQRPKLDRSSSARQQRLLDALQQRRSDTSQPLIGGRRSTDTRTTAEDIAIVKAVEKEVDKVKQLFASSLMDQQHQLEQDAEIKRQQLRERLAARAKAMGARMDPDVLQVEENKALDAIEHNLENQMAQLATTMNAEGTAAINRLERDAVAIADDVNRFLADCRVQYDKEAAVLRERLKRKRAQAEANLIERLKQQRDGMAPEVERRASEQLENDLKEKEATAIETLIQKQTAHIKQILNDRQNDVARAVDSCKNTVQTAEAELERLRADHAHGLADLHASLATERARQMDALQQRLATRRAARTTEDSAQLDEDDRHQVADLEEKLTQHETQVEKDTVEEYEAQEQEANRQLLAAVADASVALAVRGTLDAIEQAEVDRLRAELGAGQQMMQNEQAFAKTRLQERLARRNGRRGGAGVGLKLPLNEADAIVDTVIEAAIEDQIQRVRDQHAVELHNLRDQLEHDAERHKATLRDRLSRKKAAAAALRATSVAVDVPTETQLQTEEEQAIHAIEVNVHDQIQAAEARVKASETEIAEHAEAMAVDHIDDLERRLSQCRTQYEQDVAALRDQLAREREVQEQSLRNRLDQRRLKRSASIKRARDDAGITISPAEERAIESQLKVRDEQEYQAMEAQLAKDEQTAMQALQNKYAQQIDAITRRLEDEASSRQVTAINDQTQAAAELERLRQEHDQARRDLIAAYEVEQTKQRQRLQKKLDQLRAKAGNLSPEAKITMDARDELDKVALDAELDATLEAAIRNERTRRGQDEAAPMKAINDAVGDVVACEATRRAAKALKETEMAALEDVTTSKTKSKLRERGVGTPGDVNPSTIASAVMDRVLADELERTQAQYHESLKRRQDEIDAEAASRKAMLQERMGLKKKVLALRAASTPPGPERDALLAEQANLGATGRMAENMIDAESEVQKQKAQEAAERQRSVAQAALRDATQSSSDDLEKLLTACRVTHENESKALRQSLEQERQRREFALRERLAKRRADKSADLEKSLVGKPLEEQQRAREILEHQLAAEEKSEMDRLTQGLEQEEMEQRAVAMTQLQKNTTEALAQAERAARDRQELAQSAHVAAEDELRRVMEEHQRESMALKASLEAERRRQEQKMQDKLAARRAPRRADGMSEEQIAVEEQLELFELKEELQRRAATAIVDERQRQEEEEQTHTAVLARFGAQAGAADAERQAIEAARTAELERIRLEFEASRRQSQEDEGVDAQSRKAKLAERLAQRQRRDKEIKRDEHEVATGIDPKLVASGTIDNALDEELERTRRQYDESLKHQQDEIDTEAARRKAMLRERLALKKQALTLRAAAATSEPERNAIIAEQVALGATEAAKMAEIDAEIDSRKRVAREEIGHQQRVVQDALRAAAQSTSEDIVKLLEACQAAHETESEALRKSLEQERQRRELALRDRLAKRRADRVMETDHLVAGKPQDEQQRVREALAQELAANENSETIQLLKTLEQEEMQCLTEAMAKHQHHANETLAEAERAARQRHESAITAQTAAEEELQLVREEHERESVALKASLEAERRRQEQKLQDKLAARRAQRRTEGMSEEQIAVEEQLELVELKDELEQRATRAMENERHRQDGQEQVLISDVTSLSANAAAADAERRAIEAARTAELERIRLEFEDGRRQSQEDDLADAQSRKAKLAERLAQRQRRDKETKTNEHEVVTGIDPKLVASATIDNAVDDELERTRRQYDESLNQRQKEIEAEAARRKGMLHERMNLKRKALALRAASTPPGPEHDAVIAEQAATDETEAAAIADIDAEVNSRAHEMVADVERQHQVVADSLRSAAESVNDDIDRLLEACRAAHDKQSQALRQSLDQERQRREMALRDRLAKRREQKLAEATIGKSMDDQQQAVVAMEAALAGEERREHELLLKALADEEAKRLADAEAMQRRQATERLEQAQREVKERQEATRAAQLAVEEELRRVREEHKRESAALKASLEAVRRRQEQKLQEKLVSRRAQRRAEGVSEEQITVDEQLELAELKDELQQRAAKALDDERLRQEEQEQTLVMDLAKLASQAAAAEAARLAIERAQEAELDRIATEFERNRRRVQDEDAMDAQARKDKLKDRLAQRRRREKKSVKEEPGVEIPDERVDTKAIASAAMESAVDDELERIKQQYADSLKRRVGQIQEEAAAKKAALRDRIEQKRRVLAMRGGPANAMTQETEEKLYEEQAATEAAIDDEVSAKLKAAVDENEHQQRAAHEALQVATTASSDGLERLIEACQQAHTTDGDGLRRTLEQERKLKEQLLQDRLAKRREQKLAEAKQTRSFEAIEKELMLEAEREEKQLAQALGEEETRRLREAKAAQQHQAAKMMEQVEKEAQARGESARAIQAAAEDELRRVKDEHERERAALQASLETERKRQEQKLQDKLAARRAQRQHQSPADQEKLTADDELERIKLEEELQAKAAKALEDERRRHEEQEQAIAQQIAVATAEAKAAEATKKAIEAAREAEIDRIGAEFEASRRRTVDEDTAEAETRRAKLDERLAQKRRRQEKKKKSSDVSQSTLMQSATKRIIVVQRSLRSMTESHAEKEIERLRNEHAAASEERLASLERDAAVRKARLAERIAAKRNEAKASSTQDIHDVEKALDNEMEAEMRAIDDELAIEKQKVVDEITKAHEQVSAGVQAAVQRSADEMEHMLLNCKQAHEQETANLQRALELERQRQEKTLQDRIAKRKQQRQLVLEQQQVTMDTAPSVAPVAQDDADEEREKRELTAQLDAKEAQVWEEMRRKQEAELLSLTQQAEAAARQKQEEAKLVQESAQVELDRLKREHEVEMATLTASLEAEQKRQQQQLQQRIAARRNKQQKQQKEVEDLVEQERLAQQLAEQEAADKLALEHQLQAELAQRLEQERERQRQQEEELTARVAQANIEAAAAEAARQAMDAARAVELERLAKEFDEKSRELRETHMTDLMTQKQKLEARVAAKKQKKLMELEAKRELERQKLREKIEQEERAAQMEQQRADDAMDKALAIAAADSEVGDAAAPPIKATNEDSRAQSAIVREDEEPAVPPPHIKSTKPTNEPVDESARAAQQTRDITAIQQLFATHVVPERMPLLAAIELILNPRHQEETSLLLAQQYQSKTEALRDALREILKQKAAAKARLMQTNAADDHDQQLKRLDLEFDEKIRTIEAAVSHAYEAQATIETQRLKDQQFAELQFLLTYFSAAWTAAVERLKQQETAQAKERAPVDQDPLPRRWMLPETNDTDDRINDLRARLQLEADDRIQQLVVDKQNELERLETEIDAEKRRLDDELDQLVMQETAAMEATFRDRVRTLPTSSRSRIVLETEKNNQISTLQLMLRGRRAQQDARTERRRVAQRETIEHEYTRKMEIVTATKHQRIVEEKELLLQKQKALAKATDDPKAPRQLNESSTRAVSADDDDLRRTIELRLRTIEELLQSRRIDEVKKSELDVDTYKQSIKQAIDEACSWPVSVASDARTDTTMEVVPRETMDSMTQTRVDFATTLVEMMESSDVAHVAVAVTVSYDQVEGAFTRYDATTRTLWLPIACLTQLSMGQLALLLVHGVAKANTKRHDVADPVFMGCVYRLLVQCYENLFHQSSAVNNPPPPEPVASKLVPSLDIHIKPVPSKETTSNQWQSHVYALESFLSDLDASLPHSDPQSLRRQTTLTLSARRLLLLDTPDASNPAMEALVVHERRQFLQEKLDAAERLYTHVLRQHTEQKQAREAVLELLEQAQDVDEARSDLGRLDELQQEAKTLEVALDKTRKERDELFAQCQHLRDELEHLPASRPSSIS